MGPSRTSRLGDRDRGLHDMANRIAMHPVDSSSIAGAGYDCGEQILRLRYSSSRTYDYLDVPEEVYEAFLEAPSKGQFVNWHIKPVYRFRRAR